MHIHKYPFLVFLVFLVGVYLGGEKYMTRKLLIRGIIYIYYCIIIYYIDTYSFTLLSNSPYEEGTKKYEEGLICVLHTVNNAQCYANIKQDRV